MTPVIYPAIVRLYSSVSPQAPRFLSSYRFYPWSSMDLLLELWKCELFFRKEKETLQIKEISITLLTSLCFQSLASLVALATLLSNSIKATGLALLKLWSPCEYCLIEGFGYTAVGLGGDPKVSQALQWLWGHMSVAMNPPPLHAF